MRALPARPVRSAPAYVLGASVIRGAATAVVDLAGLLDEPRTTPPARYVLLRGAAEPVALAVDAVEGVRSLTQESVGHLPRLLRDLGARHVSSLAALDGELVPILASTLALSATAAPTSAHPPAGSMRPSAAPPGEPTT